MRILITGGAGLVGSPISERFVSLGWDVRVIGIDSDCPIKGVQYSQCDILDVAALARHVEGCDAIVHLAAIPTTRTHPNETLFDINVTGTYNVFEAASRAGVKRIAQASSINAIGGYWGCDDRRYDYFPLDEDLPCIRLTPIPSPSNWSRISQPITGAALASAASPFACQPSGMMPR